MFRCKMCNIWNIKDDYNTQTTMQQKKNFVRSLRGFVDTDFEFHLSGGEPLMSEGVLELVNFISGEGYRTNIVTNGFLIDELMAKEIVNSKLGTLTLSLDGIRSQTHDFIRGVKGSFRRIIKAIEYLDKYRKGSKLKIAILTTIMKTNLNEILKLAKWTQRNRKIEMISFQAVTQPFCQEMDRDWFKNDKNRFLWPDDLKKVSKVMRCLKKMKASGYKIGNHQNHFLHFNEYFAEPNIFLKKIKCNLGDYEFHVDPYGKIFFCCLTEGIGNIKTDNLAVLWDSVKTQETRKEVYGCKKNCHIMINCFYEDELPFKDKPVLNKPTF
ncbi:MAG: radical SAM protein [Candidatus Omnitrophica bacterium]|nr:radical SAM protein [Candidatus Omnitrophota bacterium]